MEYNCVEYEQINDLEGAFIIVENLIKVLYEFEYNEIILEILHEKTEVMKSKLNELIASLLICSSK